MESKQQYLMGFSFGGLNLQESIIVTEQYLQIKSWPLTRKKVIEDNLFQNRVSSSTKRALGEIVPRLQQLSENELDIFLNGSEDAQKQILWVAICRRYKFIADFMVEVIRDKRQSLIYTLTKEDFSSYWIQKSIDHPEVEKLSDKTREKLRSVLFIILRETELINSDGYINTIILDPLVKEVLEPNELKWFITFDDGSF